MHYRDACIGCNSCVEYAPRNWEIQKSDGKAVLKNAECKKSVFVLRIHEEDKEQNLLAARDCPMKIIKVNP